MSTPHEEPAPQPHVYICDAVRDVERLHAPLLGSEDFIRWPVGEQLDRQAARLLEAHGRGERAAVVHVSNWHPKLVGGGAEEILAAHFTVEDARATMAREYGFGDWADAEARGREPSDPDFEAAVDVVITGDVAHLDELLARRPELAAARSRYGHRSTVLHYVGSNGVETRRQKVPENLAAIARQLLAAGADVNATAEMYGGGTTTLALLLSSSHAADAGVQDEVAAVLRDAGAR